MPRETSLWLQCHQWEWQSKGMEKMTPYSQSSARSYLLHHPNQGFLGHARMSVTLYLNNWTTIFILFVDKKVAGTCKDLEWLPSYMSLLFKVKPPHLHFNIELEVLDVHPFREVKKIVYCFLLHKHTEQNMLELLGHGQIKSDRERVLK